MAIGRLGEEFASLFGERQVAELVDRTGDSFRLGAKLLVDHHVQCPGVAKREDRRLVGDDPVDQLTLEGASFDPYLGIAVQLIATREGEDGRVQSRTVPEPRPGVAPLATQPGAEITAGMADDQHDPKARELLMQPGEPQVGDDRLHDEPRGPLRHEHPPRDPEHGLVDEAELAFGAKQERQATVGAVPEEVLVEVGPLDEIESVVPESLLERFCKGRAEVLAFGYGIDPARKLSKPGQAVAVVGLRLVEGLTVRIEDLPEPRRPASTGTGDEDEVAQDPSGVLRLLDLQVCHPRFPASSLARRKDRPPGGAPPTIPPFSECPNHWRSLWFPQGKTVSRWRGLRPARSFAAPTGGWDQAMQHTRPERIAIVSPARDEERTLPRTIESLVAQTVRPSRWVIVDDGSRDRTAEIAETAAREHDWIQVLRRPDRGYRKVGGGVIEAFEAGQSAIDVPYDFVAKMDVDLEFGPTYLERVLAEFERDPRLAAASGKVYRREGDRLVEEFMVDEMVAGQFKLYRREALERIGGFVREVMWDGIDFHRARMLGLRTASLDDPELRIVHLRLMGSSDRSVYRGRLRWGRGQWFMGSSLPYVLASGLFRMRDRPYVLGGLLIVGGYLGAALRGAPRYEDREFRRELRRWQRARLGSLLRGQGVR